MTPLPHLPQVPAGYEVTEISPENPIREGDKYLSKVKVGLWLSVGKDEINGGIHHSYVVIRPIPKERIMEQDIDTTKEPLLLPRAVEWLGGQIVGAQMFGGVIRVLRINKESGNPSWPEADESHPAMADLCARVRALAKPWKSAGELSVKDLTRMVGATIGREEGSRKDFVRDYCRTNRIKIKEA